MALPKRRDVFTIRIIYKCGVTHDFDVYSFTKNGRRYEYEAADSVKRPLELGADEIAAIWQIGHKSVLIKEEKEKAVSENTNGTE